VQGSFRQVGQKHGTIGHPVPGVAVRVVDAETRQPLPIGSEGLLLVKGPNVMRGYLDRPDLTAEAINDGWYATGDIARIDEDGFITITDRMSRFSKIGGEMVPHYKIEEIVHRILDTHEQLCVVVGVPDERKGERLVVLHKPLPIDIDTLWERLRADGIPPLWLPAKNAFFEISELPVLGSGKLDLKGIKALAHEKAKAHWR
jgi:acyl-[acyl-carrier-protein]-phospholipid O-acyltransferase/long-chain-fatty-acid--[acyl-carrier-protein] ligase